jgi:hypothetical protein
VSTPNPAPKAAGDYLDPLTDYMRTKAPETIREHYHELLRVTHKLLTHSERQLFWTRVIAIALGAMYLTK